GRAMRDVHGGGAPRARRAPGLWMHRSEGWRRGFRLRSRGRRPVEPPDRGHARRRGRGGACAAAGLLSRSTRLGALTRRGRRRARVVAVTAPERCVSPVETARLEIV